MKKAVIRDTALTLLILACAFFVSIFFQKVFDISEHISTFFAFAVFLISLVTKGYVYGISAAFIGTLAVNYAFTFPYFAFNFTTPVNVISAIVMVIIALLTGALTTQIKHQEAIKAEHEKERMRANLLRAVSHDIRTPLTSIYGSAEALSEQSDSLTDEQKASMLEGIKQDSEWLVRMVENLLSVTRLDGGKVKIAKTPTMLDELVDSVLIKFRKRYAKQDIEIDTPEDIVFIPMDALLIEQVLVNLLENAAIHAVGASKIWFRIMLKGSEAVFEIEDNGCGIPDEKLKGLFDGYLQSDNTIADSRKKNAGIGLSVCATIIKAHGGTISARNTGNGALFRFTLDTEDANNEQ